MIDERDAGQAPSVRSAATDAAVAAAARLGRVGELDPNARRPGRPATETRAPVQTDAPPVCVTPAPRHTRYYGAPRDRRSWRPFLGRGGPSGHVPALKSRH